MAKALTPADLSRRPLRVAAMLAVAMLCMPMVQCLGRHSITALYNTNTCPPRSVTVLPIQDASLSDDVAMDYTERVVESMRRMYPGVRVRIDKTMAGPPEKALLDYAQDNVHSSYFVYGNIWSPRYDNKNSEVEILARSIANGSEVWSVAAEIRVKDARDSDWENAVGEAVDSILKRLPTN